MKDFKTLREEALRQQQRQQEVFKEGDTVMSSRTGDKGHIHRVGGNYAIVISEHGNMFREWIKNCLLYTSPSPRDGCRSRMPSSA